MRSVSLPTQVLGPCFKSVVSMIYLEIWGALIEGFSKDGLFWEDASVETVLKTYNCEEILPLIHFQLQN